MPNARTSRERGSAMVEFCFCSLIWLPVLLGTMLFGLALIQSIQISQLSRDTGHMYARGVDFTNPQSLQMLTTLASPLKTQKGWNGAIVLSTITLVTQSDCDAAAVKVCTNNGSYVFTDIYVFGNRTYAQTQLGSPSPKYLNNTPIQVSQYLTDTSLVASNFSSYNLPFVPGQPGQQTYVSEVTVNAQNITWSSFTNTRAYARTFF